MGRHFHYQPRGRRLYPQAIIIQEQVQQIKGTFADKGWLIVAAIVRVGVVFGKTDVPHMFPNAAKRHTRDHFHNLLS